MTEVGKLIFETGCINFDRYFILDATFYHIVISTVIRQLQMCNYLKHFIKEYNNILHKWKKKMQKVVIMIIFTKLHLLTFKVYKSISYSLEKTQSN